MIYKAFRGEKLSALGLGAMRLPTAGDQIDVEATAQMVAYAMEKGINYYDTAWGYHNGESELVMGKLLSAYPRESFHLASKFPGYDLSNMGKVAEIFEKQLEKCRISYFDFYLFHNVCELNIDGYLDPQYGIYGASAIWAFPRMGRWTPCVVFLRPTARTWSSVRSSSIIWTGAFRRPRKRSGC